MSITFSCPCGRSMKVRDERAGKKLRCPECGAAVRVPEAGGPDRSQSAITQMYTEQASTEIAREEARQRSRHRYGRQEDGGFVMPGLIITRGVMIGGGMVLSGLIGLLYWMYADLERSRSTTRLGATCIASMIFGGITLARSILWNDED